jgi:CRP/FNR family cyclic AMP-dependent transcriptional regulator
MSGMGSHPEALEGQRLTREELDQMAPQGFVREYRPRSTIVCEGDDTDALYIVLEGRLRVYLSDAHGREIELSTLGPGEYFGELACDGGPRSASVASIERCRMLVVPREHYLAFVERNPAFMRRLVAKLTGQVRRLTDNVRSLGLMDAYGRVARVLLEAAVVRDGEQFVPERLTQAAIASRAGCSREMVSRIFKDLAEGGYISLEPDRILIRRRPPDRW